MIITAFILTSVWLFFLQWKVSKEIVCPLYIYLAFMFLYVVFPYVYLLFEVEVVNIKLLNLNVLNVEHVMGLVSITNTVVAIFLSIVSTTSRHRLLSVPAFGRSDKLLTQQFLFIYPIAMLLVYLYPWAQFGTERTTGHSLAAFVKIYIVFIYCAISINARITGKVSLMFNLYTLLMLLMFVVDTARTPLFIVVLAYSYANRLTLIGLIKSWHKVFLLFLLFLWVTLARTGIEFNIAYALWPIFSEAIFGSYSALNASAINMSIGASVVTFFQFFLDQIFLVFPEVFVNLFDYEFYFNIVTTEGNNQGILEGRISPLGGFFIVADMLIYFGYFGSLVLAAYVIIYLNLVSRGNSAFYGFLFFSSFMLVKSPVFAFVNQMILVAAFFLFVRSVKVLLHKGRFL